MSTLRICTWNVRGLRDDAAAAARVLRTIAPDVVALQETPRAWRWRSRLAALARQSGLLYVAGGASAGGTALLAAMRLDVRESRELLLTRTTGLEQRGATLARVRLAGSAEVAVVAVHLGLDADERARHVRELHEAVAALGAPYAVLAGDLNERPGQPAWAALAAGRTDCGDGDPRPTYPRHREWRIDGIFAERGLDVLSYDVVDGPDARAGSDHLPVVVSLGLHRTDG